MKVIGTLYKNNQKNFPKVLVTNDSVYISAPWGIQKSKFTPEQFFKNYEEQTGMKKPQELKCDYTLEVPNEK